MKQRTARIQGFFFLLLVAIMSLGLVACGAPPDSVQPTQIESSKQALHNSSGVYAFRYTDTGTEIPHGIVGDKRYVFVTKPLDGKVSVLSRLTGRHIADLPAPPGGFLLPFTLRIPSKGKLVILDSGGFPSPTGFATPSIYTYTYRRNCGRFEATLTKTTTITSIVVGFSEDVEVLANGDMVLSDSVFGALWLIKPDGSVLPGITPASPAPQDAIPALSGCAFPSGVVVDGIPFSPIGGFAPGVGSMTSRNGQLYFGSTCTGGISRVPLSVFYDQRAPHLRANDIQVVSAKPANVVAETIKGLKFNTYNPNDNALYVANSFELKIQKINVQTGQRTDVVQNDRLFNFTVALAFLPPLIPGTDVLVTSADQEHRFTGINALLTADDFVTPFLLTKVLIRR